MGVLGKVVGGGLGGFLAGKQELIELLRQKSRAYLFSNSLPPSMLTATLAALDVLEQEPERIQQLRDNADYFRREVAARGFKTLEGQHAIVPVMLGEASVAQEMSKRLLAAGLYVVGLWFPVVPEGQARLRIQISAAHTREQLDRALEIMDKVGREMGIII